MLKRRMPAWITLAVAAACAAAIAITAVKLARVRVEDAARIAKLETEKRGLQGMSGKLQAEVDALRQGAPPASVPQTTGGPRPEHHGLLPSTALEKEIAQMRENVSAANATIAALQARISELEAGIDKLSQDNKTLAASEADFKDRLAGATRVLEAVQTELKGKNDRLVQSETTNSMLHDENRALSDKTARLTQLLRSLDEINRRRETFLSSILRRYRDVTDQYRTLSGRLESPRDNAAGPGPELGRIQNSIAMAEEDLRQLTGLNAQAARLQQKLATK